MLLNLIQHIRRIKFLCAADLHIFCDKQSKDLLVFQFRRDFFQQGKNLTAAFINSRMNRP